MPMEDNLLRRMVWEIVSKAAVRSRRMRMESKPESAAIRRSLVNHRVPQNCCQRPAGVLSGWTR